MLFVYLLVFTQSARERDQQIGLAMKEGSYFALKCKMTEF